MRKGETMMKIIAINPIPFKKRMIEFLFDYLFILAYLVLLFLGSMLIYIILFNGVPEFTEIQSQWLVFFTSVLPITLLFTFLDYTNNGSFGKVKAGLQLVYQKKTVQASLIRNTIKFLPWNSVIWARYMVSIVSLMCYPLASLFRRLSLQFCYWQ